MPRVKNAPRGDRGVAMEGLIAARYAKTTLPDIEEYRSLAKTIAARVRPGAKVLEVAPGPGHTAIELARLGSFKVTGMDISATFVEMGRRNAREAGVAVDFGQGDAASMPFPDDTFDFVVCRAAFKSFAQPLCALLEMHRVLKRPGAALIVDLKPDVTPQVIDDYISRGHRRGASAVFLKWKFLQCLRRAAHSREEFESLIARTGFSGYEIREEPMDYMVWLFKE
ncbi:MAG TPA: class I SAM-dependent methyltransferase [Spirochaetia bacterium]|nr:class I SAM-dependent methyltransferase [Spirochaetia bacterium]